MIQNECKILAEWFFRQKVKAFGDSYIVLADGTKVTFLPDADANLVEAMVEKMMDQAEFDHIGITMSRTDAENRYSIAYHKFKTRIGTTYTLHATGRNLRDAEIKSLLKFIKNGTMI